MKAFSPAAIAWSRALFVALVFSFISSTSGWSQPSPATAKVVIDDDGKGTKISPLFMGLSYEMSALLPRNGKYYFDAKDQALINTFRTLGIKSLRVGANAVDSPEIPVPQEKDIDAFFAFARAAGVKVIYSFRLKNGDPAVSARLASYIAAHDADALDCYSIGNEPNAYDKTFDAYFADWKPHYDAILKGVPHAMFDGPSVYAGSKNLFPEKLADAMFPGGHMAMISDHYYVMGNGRDAENALDKTRARFFSNAADSQFAKEFAAVGSKLTAKGIPYRIDELNNCFHGGAKGISDTYAASIWALDASHWWAARHMLGLNYHTGERTLENGDVVAQNYSAFLHLRGGNGFEIRPPSYGYLAFTQSALGRPLTVQMTTTATDHFTAYAYRANDESVYVTLINKTFGENSAPITVSLQLPSGTTRAGAKQMVLAQKNNDITAQTDITLGGAPIEAKGVWHGKWEAAKTGSGQSASVEVPPTAAIIVHFLSAK